jgi:hypothetical protein
MLKRELNVPKRICYLLQKKGDYLPADAKSVKHGNSCRWGNPFRPRLKSIEEHQRMVDRYGAWIQEPEQAALRALVRKELAGYDLACDSPPGWPCHGDVLLQIANSPGCIGRSRRDTDGSGPSRGVTTAGWGRSVGPWGLRGDAAVDRGGAASRRIHAETGVGHRGSWLPARRVPL